MIIAVLLFILNILEFVIAKRNEIGHIPMKGNLWRAKYDNEINHNISKEFAAFIRHCRTTKSEDTGITYHYSPNGTVYALSEVSIYLPASV
ncbi:unnamed protein product [Cylicostephanus goldi]|uniref:Uncharacterized protein n=1 Tax=Cylicostephanus goldi TaxID=71465 RepID=A0A3P7R344_CYLGO|nr:unnamed protein product [Cylicostephanus goldi]